MEPTAADGAALSRAEERAWRGYRAVRVRLDLLFARELAAAGLTEAEYDVLSALAETKGHRLRLSELAGGLSWSSSRASHQVARMQSRGLVGREGSAADARGAVVVLTAAGRAAAHRAEPVRVAAVRRHLLAALTPAQVRALADITESILARPGGAAG